MNHFRKPNPQKTKHVLTSFFSLVTSISLMMTQIAQGDFLDEIPELENKEDSTKPGPGESEKEGLSQSELPLTSSSGEKSASSSEKKEQDKSELDSENQPNSDNQQSQTENEKQAQKEDSSKNEKKSSRTKSSKAGLNHNSEATVQVEGDTVQGLRQEGKLILVGNVKIEQDGAVLTSDEATVFAEPNTTQTQRALAKGNVKFRKKATSENPEIRGQSEELEFLVSERTMVLKGKPKLWRGEELIQGRVIEVDLDSGRVKIKGARGVVKPSPAP